VDEHFATKACRALRWKVDSVCDLGQSFNKYTLPATTIYKGMLLYSIKKEKFS